MSPSYDRRRDLVGENQHRPGDTTFPVSNWAILTFLTGLHMPQRTDCNMHFHDKCLSPFNELFLFKEVVWFGYIDTWHIQSSWSRSLSRKFWRMSYTKYLEAKETPPKIAGPINKAPGNRKSKMWAVLVHLTMYVAGCPFFALLWLNPPKVMI